MPVIKNSHTKAQKQQVVHTEMHKFKQGKLHSGSEHGPTVTNPKQAVAIALSESGQSRSKAMRHQRKGGGLGPDPSHMRGHAKDHGGKFGMAEHHERPARASGHTEGVHQAAQPHGGGTGEGKMKVAGHEGVHVPSMAAEERTGGNSVIAHPQHHPGHPNKGGTPGHPHHMSHNGDHGPGHTGKAAGGHEHREGHHANPHHHGHHPSHPSHPDHPETMANHTEHHSHGTSAKAAHHPPSQGEPHKFSRPPTQHAHGYGHHEHQRQGHHRHSGHSGAHRVGHRGK
jgi:Family of unknown function (DUF6496)